MAAPDYSHKWETLRARRAPAERHSACRAARSGRRSAGDRARACARRWKRRARPPRWSRPTASSPAAFRRCSRAGASRPTTAPASRCRQAAPGTLLLGIASAARRGPGAGAAARAAQASAGRRRGRGARRVARSCPRARPRAARTAAAGRARRARCACSPRSRRCAHGAQFATASQGSTALLARARAAFALRGDAWRGGDEAGGRCAWRGPDGRMAAELVAELQARESAARLTVAPKMPCRCFASCSTSARCARPMAVTRASSSGACSKRGFSAPTCRPRRPQRRRVAGASRA